MSPIRRLAQMMVSTALIAEGVNVVRHPDAHALQLAPLLEKAEGLLPAMPSPATTIRISGTVVAIAGAMAGAGRAPRIAGTAAALILAPATVAGYRFWRIKDKTDRTRVRREFLAHLSLTGAALLLAGDTAGNPSIAWRVHHRPTKKAAELAANA